MGALLSACSDYSSSADEKFSASVVCPENMRGSFTDSRDGQEYKFTTIGNQVWMAENLKFDDGSLCVEDSCSPKGRIYGMNPALASCPTGWHLPSKDEWFELFDNVGGIDSAGIRLKATNGWIPLNSGQLSNGTDDCGFGLQPIPASSAFTNGLGGKKNDGYIALLWTSSRSFANDYSMEGVYFETQTIRATVMTYYDEWDYLSVRCVKN